MTRGVVTIGAITAIAFFGTYYGVPIHRRASARDDLRQAATEFCACAIGSRGDIAARLEGVDLAIAAGADLGKGHWPDRCLAYYESAYAAYRHAWNLDLVRGELREPAKLRSALAEQGPSALGSAIESLQSFWEGTPRPSVPLPPNPLDSTFAVDSVTPLAEGDYPFRIDEATRVQGSLTLAFNELFGGTDAELTCTLTDATSARCSRVDPSAPIPLDAEPGARPLSAVSHGDDVTIVDAAGARVLTTRAVRWGRSFADGHAIVFDRGGDLEDTRSKRRWPFNLLLSRASAVVGDWFVFKGSYETENDGARTMASNDMAIHAVKLSDGANARPVTIGPAGPRPGRARTYGHCTADVLVADLDPNLAFYDGSSWKVHGRESLPASNTVGRHLTCTNGAAFVTEWFPLELERCDAKSCEPVALGDYHGDLQSDFAFDGTTLYAAREVGTSLLVTVVPVAHPEQRKTIPLLHANETFVARARGDEGRFFHLVGGCAVVVTSAKKGPRVVLRAIAVHPDGSVTAVSPAQNPT